mmetsp:Transcript_2995/g.6523  ORF Transcript_2995/g.6523 Transcript_2995/m.6523 type:complete len:245 (+) Transcript_2995:293-1027(+)
MAAMKETRNESANKMGGQHDHEDVDALVGYIQQLELNIEKQVELLAAKDQRIDSLEAEVAGIGKAAAPIFRAKATAEVPTPTFIPGERKTLLPSTPNHVSDDSGEIEPESSEGSLSHSLSHISQANSSDEDLPIDYAASDGRWIIPFDGSFEDVVAKSPRRTGNENALKEIGFVGFVPIGGREGRGHRSDGTEVTLLRPVARRSHGASPFTQAIRRGLLKDSLNEKENVSPKRSGFQGVCSPIR